MPKQLIDMTGERVGRLVVIRRAESRGKSTYWLCRCECGVEKDMAASSLRTGTTVSCGCHRREQSSRMMTAMSLKHGGSRTSLYTRWREMRYRCRNKNATAYPSYGGRGISVCPEWEEFSVFQDWALANGYHEGLTLDRKDNDGNYEPGNCRWVDMRAQSNNRRSNRFITHNGLTMTPAQWARKLGINRSAVYSRIRAGLPDEEVLSLVISPINRPQYVVTPTTNER